VRCLAHQIGEFDLSAVELPNGVLDQIGCKH
jgi:hypothetical protein